MLLNPCQGDLPVVQGTRLLVADLGVMGVEIIDPINKDRRWTATAVYAPARRRINGIRVKLVDQKDFVTFCNQRDFEVLIGLARPGDWCQWAAQPYAAPDDRDWFGLCMDQTDFEDDLYDRELFVRAQCDGVLPEGSMIYRRAHPEPTRDVEDTYVMLRDYDINTGLCPDTRIETINQRWARASRDWVKWERT